MTASLVFMWMLTTAIGLALYWPSIVIAMPWEREYAGLQFLSPLYPHRPYADIILTCQARTRSHWFTRSSWFIRSNWNEELTEFTWSADFRDEDGRTIAQLASDHFANMTSFHHGQDTFQHEGRLDADVIWNWLEKAFPMTDSQYRDCLEASAKAIMSQIQSWTEMPCELAFSSEPKVDVSKTPSAQMFPGIRGEIGTIASRPAPSAVALVLGAFGTLWLACALLVLLFGRRVLKRRLAIVAEMMPRQAHIRVA